MTIAAQIIADSISPEGIRLTTFQLRYPRFIHAEELTHRVLKTQPELIIYEAIPDGLMYDQNLSRNASSSRAIPVKRMIEELKVDPAMPIYWGSNKPGMQAGAELEGEALNLVKNLWLEARDAAIFRAELMVENGLHKQIANRILEPWAHINVIVTATDWANFYTLRRHKDAQPEIKALADMMWDAQQASTPRLLKPGQWHLPYIDEHDQSDASERNAGDGTDNPHTLDHMIEQDLIKVSVARCARVSYLTFEGKTSSFEEDLQLYDRLLGSQPLHASPAEHQATPLNSITVWDRGQKQSLFKNAHLQGNLRGWAQYRKMLEGEFIPD